MQSNIPKGPFYIGPNFDTIVQKETSSVTETTN